MPERRREIRQTPGVPQGTIWRRVPWLTGRWRAVQRAEAEETLTREGWPNGSSVGSFGSFSALHEGYILGFEMQAKAFAIEFGEEDGR